MPRCAFPPRLATTAERGEDVSIGRNTAVRSSPARPGPALAAAGGGADRTAHAELGRGLGLRLGTRFGFWLGRVIVGGPGFGLSVPVSTGIIAPGL